MLDDATAERLLEEKTIIWHQKFRLSPNFVTPGSSDIEWLLSRLPLPSRLDGLTLLDIGTTNGAAAFIAEARGAKRVVATDIFPPTWFGFAQLADTLNSDVEFIQSSIYQLPDVLAEPFDVVLFLGVLYHLRHPLLGLDAVRMLTKGTLFIESAIANPLPGHPGALFFRRDELSGDSSNWFVPDMECLRDWLESSGFQTVRSGSWPETSPTRGLYVCSPAEGRPEYLDISYEVPLSTTLREPLSRPSPS
jgi:tRNA (mo5U34)-methyltransferase